LKIGLVFYFHLNEIDLLDDQFLGRIQGHILQKFFHRHDDRLLNGFEKNVLGCLVCYVLDRFFDCPCPNELELLDVQLLNDSWLILSIF
jgi:hypothetical protein